VAQIVPVNVAVAPVIANDSGTRRAGQGRDSGERSERTLGAPKRTENDSGMLRVDQ